MCNFYVEIENEIYIKGRGGHAKGYASFDFLLSYMQLTLMISPVTPLCRACLGSPMRSSEKGLCTHWMTAAGDGYLYPILPVEFVLTLC